MQAYEAIKRLKLDRKAFLEEHGLKSHMSKLPDALVEELFGEEKKIQTGAEGAPEVDSTEAVVVEVADETLPETETVSVTPESEACPFTPRQIAKSIRCLGNKSPCWKWRDQVG